MAVRSFSSKQPYEEYYVAFDFFRVIDDGATISSATVSAVDALGASATSTVTSVGKQTVSGSRVNIWVQGGTAQRYKITCKIQTSTGEKYEQDAYLTVVEE